MWLFYELLILYLVIKRRVTFPNMENCCKSESLSLCPKFLNDAGTKSSNWMVSLSIQYYALPSKEAGHIALLMSVGMSVSRNLFNL